MADTPNRKATGYSGWLGAESIMKLLGPMGNRLFVSGTFTVATDGTIAGIDCEGVAAVNAAAADTFVITLSKKVNALNCLLGNTTNIVTASGAFVDDGTMIVPCALYGRLVTTVSGGTAATTPSQFLEVHVVGTDGSKVDLSSAGANNSTRINFIAVCKR